jgi:hypothetical protein
MQGIGKRFVCILRSDVDPDRQSIGLSSDVDTRLNWHNHGHVDMPPHSEPGL